MTLRGLFVGLTTIDIHYGVDTFPASNAKTVAGAFVMTVGGPATNAAISFAHLGGESHLLSAIGRHPFTSFIEHELQRYHVEVTDLSPAATQLPTISSIVTTQGGQRTVMTTRSSPTSDIRDATWIAHPDDYDVVLVDGFQMDTCCRVARQARQCELPVVLDGGSWKEGMERLFPCVDIAICSEQFRVPDGGDGGAVLAYLARQSVRYRAITRGERPIIYDTAESTGEIAIEPVGVVDTLGAGDILHGAFCRYYAEGNQFVAALQQASRVATLSCRTFGTRAWMERGSKDILSPFGEHCEKVSMERIPKRALVTGANRGMGLETCRQLARLGYQVILTSREKTSGKQAVQSLAQQGLTVLYQHLDVADPQSVQQAQQTIQAEIGNIDVLVNNAAAYPDEGRSVLEVELETFHTTLETNFFGPLALNALTRMVADAARGSNVLVNAVDPGWARTEMGGSGAPRSVEQGADTIVWLATLADGGPTGAFFHDRQPIPW